MVSDWAGLRADGADVRMLASERSVVDRLNQLARHHLTTNGEVAKRGRTFVSDDDAREIDLAVGDRVRLDRNDSRLPQPDGTVITVRNGMTGTVTRTSRRAVVVELDPDHRDPDGPAQIVLPGGYAGADLHYGYATTADKAQAATVDHSLFVPSAATSAERAYVALSRGRHSNRIYAATGSGWQEAIATSRGHTLALDQQPHWPAHHAEGRQQQPSRGPLTTARHHTARRSGAESWEHNSHWRDHSRGARFDASPGEAVRQSIQAPASRSTHHSRTPPLYIGHKPVKRQAAPEPRASISPCNRPEEVRHVPAQPRPSRPAPRPTLAGPSSPSTKSRRASAHAR
jgi:hypothetical protein